MKRIILLLLFFFITLVSASYAELDISGETSVIFATANEGREILTKRDDFVQRLSPFDRSARLKTQREISESEFLEFVGRNVLEWNNNEIQKVQSAFQGIRSELKALSLPLPEKVYIVKTTGNEEGGAAYTRSNAIVLPERYLNKSAAKIQKTICHELFHIMSRANPVLRDRFYKAIGFVKCNEIIFPPALKPQKITNPDAPMNDHYIKLEIKGDEALAVPILFSKVKQYDEERGGDFFDYIQLRFIEVERHNSSSIVTPVYDDNRPIFIDMRQQSGFFEQVGKNTQYIIHPEEILADNFAFLVMKQRGLPSPGILKKMEKILKENRVAEKDTSAGG